MATTVSSHSGSGFWRSARAAGCGARGELHDRAVRSAPAERESIQIRARALAEQANEFSGTVNVPGEPFLPYVTGQDAGGHASSASCRISSSRRGVSIVPPLRQDLHPGVTTTYAFTVMNLGDAGTFKLTATDDKGFIGERGSVRRHSRERIGRPDCRSPAAREYGDGHLRCADGPADSATTPGLGNFASMASVVLGPGGAHHHVHQLEHIDDECPRPRRRSRRSPRPRDRPRRRRRRPPFLHDRALHDRRWSPRAACGSQAVPPAILKKLDRATSLIDAAH
jgi:hypothetical protein